MLIQWFKNGIVDFVIYNLLQNEQSLQFNNFPVNVMNIIQSTLVIPNSKGLTETLRDIRTSTYQSWESEEDNKLNNHIQQMNM